MNATIGFQVLGFELNDINLPVRTITDEEMAVYAKRMVTALDAVSHIRCNMGYLRLSDGGRVVHRAFVFGDATTHPWRALFDDALKELEDPKAYQAEHLERTSW